MNNFRNFHDFIYVPVSHDSNSLNKLPARSTSIPPPIFQNAQNGQNTQQYQVTQHFQNAQQYENALELQNARNYQNVENVQNGQNAKLFQNPTNVQNFQNAVNSTACSNPYARLLSNRT